MKMLLTVSMLAFCVASASASAAEQNATLPARSFEQRLPHKGGWTVAYIECSVDAALFNVTSREFPRAQAYVRPVVSSVWSSIPLKIELVGGSKYRITVSPQTSQVSSQEKCSDLEVKLIN